MVFFFVVVVVVGDEGGNVVVVWWCRWVMVMAWIVSVVQVVVVLVVVPVGGGVVVVVVVGVGGGGVGCAGGVGAERHEGDSRYPGQSGEADGVGWLCPGLVVSLRAIIISSTILDEHRPLRPHPPRAPVLVLLIFPSRACVGICSHDTIFTAMRRGRMRRSGSATSWNWATVSTRSQLGRPLSTC